MGWTELLQEIRLQFLAQMQGGIGPDVWDKECFIDAADFIDAAEQANYKAGEFGGQVTLLEQCDCSEEESIVRAVNRFLTWPLPATVSADQCACLAGYKNRYGTNLMSGIEAREMLRHVLGL